MEIGSRVFGWLGRCLSKDFERTIASALAALGRHPDTATRTSRNPRQNHNILTVKGVES